MGIMEDILTSGYNPFHLAQEAIDTVLSDPPAQKSGGMKYFLDFRAALKKTRDPNIKTAKLLSVTDIVFNEVSVKYSDDSTKATNALTETLDTTTYPDKAILRLKNERGFDVYLKSMVIHGKRIMQYSGENGELIHDSLKRDDDIRRNGETTFEIGNEYIVTADQCARIADYWYKYLGKKKHIYSLTIPGFAVYYNVGDWYNLQVGEADTNEYIDAVVECYSVDVERSAGGIGSTTLLLRDVEDNWSKTTLYTARLATGGSPKRRVNRSNIVTVASSEYDGTYDWRCDGTDDDVEIQAAIDYVYNTFGGGTVLLTGGAYTLGATVTMKTGIVLKGVGGNSILYPESASITTMIDFGTSTQSRIEDFVIDGDGTNITFITDTMKIVDGQLLGISTGITIQNYAFSCTSGTKNFYGFYEIDCTNCYFINNANSNIGTISNLRGFSNCKSVSSCSSYSNTTTGTDSRFFSFNLCLNISSSSSYSNSTSGTSANIYSFNNCKNITACSSYSNSTSGTSAGVYSYISSDNISACSSYSNTTSGTSAPIYSYNDCKRITVSNTYSNASALSNEYGFNSCKSLQQCNSTDDSDPYTSSYADSGTSNAAADTYQGGFNS